MTEKNQFNAPVYKQIADGFDVWQGKLAGKKGEKIGAGLVAIQALCRIDESILYDLMKPDVTIDQAFRLILDRVSDAEIRRLSKPLTRKQRAQALKDAKESRDRIFHKEKG